MSQKFALLVPVKTLSLAKSRLEPAAGRESLMRAFALDAIDAALRCPAVSTVYVVTDEPGFDTGIETGFTGFETSADRVVRLPDEGDGDLNRALLHAERRVRLLDPATGVAAMCADLPCLEPDDLADGLGAGLGPRWFVADAPGTGTTLLAAGPGVDLDPHFGAGSALRHEQSGAVPIRAAVPTLRCDVDTDLDLDRARALGLGVRTREALAGT